MTDPVVALLEQCYTGVVHDVMRGDGLRDFTLPPEITPLLPDRKLCGPVFTIEGRTDDTADPHETLLAWTGLLSKAKSGHIWVCQPNDRVIAQMGELSAETLQAKGVLGCVIDGGIRDVEFLIRLGFQCWRRFHTPRDIVGRWLPKGVDTDIVIGEVSIRPATICWATATAWCACRRRSPRTSPKGRNRRCRPKTKSARRSWEAPTRGKLT